jgi:hypothetical protein
MRKVQAVSEQTLPLFDLVSGESGAPQAVVRPDTISAQTPEALPTEGPVNARQAQQVRQTAAQRGTSAEPPADLPGGAGEPLAEAPPANPSTHSRAAAARTPAIPDEVIGAAASDHADGTAGSPLDSSGQALSDVQKAAARFLALGAIQAARRESS